MMALPFERLDRDAAEEAIWACAAGDSPSALLHTAKLLFHLDTSDTSEPAARPCEDFPRSLTHLQCTMCPASHEGARAKVVGTPGESSLLPRERVTDYMLRCAHQALQIVFFARERELARQLPDTMHTEATRFLMQDSRDVALSAKLHAHMFAAIHSSRGHASALPMP